jgi:hypothetical protein
VPKRVVVWGVEAGTLVTGEPLSRGVVPAVPAVAAGALADAISAFAQAEVEGAG